MNSENRLCTEKKIVVVGTIFMDIKGYPQGLFHPTGRNIGTIEYVYGGVGRNVAADLAAIGCSPVFVSLSESGGHGENIVRNLQSAGVNTDYILTHTNGIGTWMVILNPEGDVCANLSKRQDLTPVCSLMKEHAQEIFADAAGILMEMDVDEEVVRTVFELARQFGLEVYGVISNINETMKRMEYVKQTKCFICNKQEAGVLFGLPEIPDDPGQMLELLKQQIVHAGPACMVVTMDKQGSVYAGTDGQTGYCAPKQVQVVDSTGAGDAFFAGAAAALISGMSLQEACELGTGMAADVICSKENVVTSGV